MGEMIERVARAMAAEGLKNAEPQTMTREKFIEGLWQQYIPQSRAAIEAMRKPTPNMKSAGSDRWVDHDSPCGVCAGQIYTAMIGEALK